jgi:MFS transporter, AAHS family, 4-hydroxybenzoate transporter
MPTAVPAAALRLSQLIDTGPWSGFQKRVLALAALAFAADGLANQVLGLAIPALVHDWGTPRQAFASVAALGLIGVALGTALGGLLGDRLGRRIGLTGSVLLFGLMTGVTSRAGNMHDLMLLRFIAGLGIGGAIPNGAALIAEFTPLRQRSVAIAIGMLFIPVGATIAGAIGAYLLPRFGWSALFLASGALTVLLGILFAFVLPESPRFLARWSERREALIALLRRCGWTLEADTEFLNEQTTKASTPLRALFGDGMLFDTLALWIAFFFCLLASYTMFSWVPTMLAGQGFSLADTSIGTTTFNIGGMVGSVVGGWLIGKVGSRVSILGLAAGSVIGAVALGLLPLDPAHGLGAAITALGAEGFFIGGFHNGLYTLAAFLYPSFVRGTGVGAAAGVGRIGAVVSSYTGVIALQLGGASGYFVVIALSVGLSLIATAAFRQHIGGRGSVPERPPRAEPAA